jgi:hypothetical protein
MMTHRNDDDSDLNPASPAPASAPSSADAAAAASARADVVTHVDCRQVADLLGDYVDEQLSGDLKTAVDSHMTMCAPCIAFLKQYRFAPQAARAVLLKAVPVELEDRLMSFLRAKCKKDG